MRCKRSESDCGLQKGYFKAWSDCFRGAGVTKWVSEAARLRKWWIVGRGGGGFEEGLDEGFVTLFLSNGQRVFE